MTSYPKRNIERSRLEDVGRKRDSAKVPRVVGVLTPLPSVTLVKRTFAPWREPRYNYSVITFTTLHAHEATETIGDSNNTIHALAYSVGLHFWVSSKPCWLRISEASSSQRPGGYSQYWDGCHWNEKSIITDTYNSVVGTQHRKDTSAALLQALLVENVRGILEPATRRKFPVLRRVSIGMKIL
jgi:hypothetical protein